MGCFNLSRRACAIAVAVAVAPPAAAEGWTGSRLLDLVLSYPQPLAASRHIRCGIPPMVGYDNDSVSATLMRDVNAAIAATDRLRVLLHRGDSLGGAERERLALQEVKPAVAQLDYTVKQAVCAHDEAVRLGYFR